MNERSSLPRVTIMTPVYNGACYLEPLIESVRQQDYPNLEHLVIDDGSIDNGATVAILQKYPHLRWWSRSNQGQYATMNEGLQAATGDLICFISADDLCAPGAVWAVVDYFLAHPGLDGVYGVTEYIWASGERYPVQPMRWMVPLWLVPYFYNMAHCSLYLKRDVLLAGNFYFDPELRYTGDYDWVVRLRQAKLKIAYFRRHLACFRVHPGQTSYSKREKMRQEKLRMLERYHAAPRIYDAIRRLLDVRSAAYRTFDSIKKNGLGVTSRKLVLWAKRKVWGISQS